MAYGTPGLPERECKCGAWFVPQESDDEVCEDCKHGPTGVRYSFQGIGTQDEQEPRQEPSDIDELREAGARAIEV